MTFRLLFLIFNKIFSLNLVWIAYSPDLTAAYI